MLNLKSCEIHWIFHTVSEIGWILSPRVFAEPSLSQHIGRLLHCGAKRAVRSEYKSSSESLRFSRESTEGPFFSGYAGSVH